MKYFLISILIIIIGLNSCTQWSETEKMRLISQVETTGIETFLPIEYGKRGNIEFYNYYFNDEAKYVWNYNNDSLKFNFEPQTNSSLFVEKIHNAEKYTHELRELIKKLNVVMISQAPWKGNFIRFWISSDEFISYVNSDFEFNTPPKKRWLAELISGEMITKNWYYVRIEKN